MEYIARENILTLNIHGMTKEEARVFLEIELETILPEIMGIEIVHGYSKGEILLQFVRKEFKHKKIKEIKIGQNPGVTYYILKSDMKS